MKTRHGAFWIRQFVCLHLRAPIAQTFYSARVIGVIRSLGFILVVASQTRLDTLGAQATPWTKSYASPAAIIEVPESLLRIDLNGTDALEFFRVVGMFPRADGSFLVVNGATNELRYFDAQGKFVSRAGRKGGGPGEYQSLQSASIVSLRGDSLAILDGMARRISIVSRTEALVRSVPTAQTPPGVGSATRIVALPSGSLLVGFAEVRTMAPQPDAVAIHDQFFTISTTSGALQPTPLRGLIGDHFVQATTPEHGGIA